jgi:4-hydroxybenzoate polyprenyltransferase
MTTDARVAEAGTAVEPRRALALLRLARPAEWAKNVLVVAPLVFSGRDSAGAIGSALLALIAFCLVSSAGYALNDTRDAPLDREHPVKRRRPVAAGIVPPRVALAAGAAWALLGFAVAAAAGGLGLVGVIAAYAALTVAYSLRLKAVVILDVMTIAACFLARVFGGAVAVDVKASAWLLVCTGSVALFLGFTKRRQEAMSELHDARRTRPVLEHYSLPFLDQMVSLVTAMAILSYTIYATDSFLVGDRMLFTVPPVLYALFRYLYLIYDRRDPRDAAELLFHDPGMLVASVTWLATAIVVIHV